jgi:putative transposase
MPGYKHTDTATFTITNQEAVIYHRKDDPNKLELKLPKTKHRLRIGGVYDTDTLKEVTVVRYYDTYKVNLVLECSELPPDYAGRNIAGVDFGCENFVAIASTTGDSMLCKGGAIKAINQLWNKEYSKAQSKCGYEAGHTKAMQALSRKRKNIIHDYMNKITIAVVEFCMQNNIGVLVLGINRGWKYKPGMGKKNNQKFVNIPFCQLQEMIRYKCERVGILVVEQEESYTSRADCIARDKIPVFGKHAGDKEPKYRFSGHRRGRGLYVTASGLVINADLNGAVNIARKAFPKAFKRVKDFTFLCDPRVLDFHSLINRTR